MIPEILRAEAIDLSKGNEHEHPDIKLDTWYLAVIDGEYCIGQFSSQWYGLNFDTETFGGAGIQFDTPGTNSSQWEALWVLPPPPKS